MKINGHFYRFLKCGYQVASVLIYLPTDSISNPKCECVSVRFLFVCVIVLSFSFFVSSSSSHESESQGHRCTLIALHCVYFRARLRLLLLSFYPSLSLLPLLFMPPSRVGILEIRAGLTNLPISLPQCIRFGSRIWKIPLSCSDFKKNAKKA